MSSMDGKGLRGSNFRSSLSKDEEVEGGKIGVPGVRPPSLARTAGLRKGSAGQKLGGEE